MFFYVVQILQYILLIMFKVPLERITFGHAMAVNYVRVYVSVKL